MPEIGYALSTEELPPLELVRNARRAEEVGFTFAMISDHFHPWISRQGNSAFAWTVIGGISQATSKLRLGTGVTCPTVRYHPALIAQAAATAAAMLPGRFMLGLGTGENLNEHIFGDHWPPIEIRQDMLTEAIEVIRMLWSGEEQSYWGTYYTIEQARLYTLPPELPPILVAAAGKKSAGLAGRIGDGLINTAPKEQIVEAFRESGGEGRPTYGQVTVCWARDEAQARRTAFEWWPNAVVADTLHEHLPTPAYFEDALKRATEEQVAQEIICGPDKRRHLEAIQKMQAAGYEQVYVHQVGPDQEGFFQFYQREILPEFR